MIAPLTGWGDGRHGLQEIRGLSPADSWSDSCGNPVPRGSWGGKRGVIDVVLHEYDSLRAEILARSDARFQLIGYLGIAATLLGTQISEGARGWLIYSGY